MGQRWYRIIVLVLAIMTLTWAKAQNISVTSQTSDPREKGEVELAKKDLRSLGVTVGMALPQGDVSFKKQMFGTPATIDASADFATGFSIQFNFTYGLDHYIAPGVGVGVKLDYAYNEIDIDLQAFQGSTRLFDYDGKFVGVHSIGLLPAISLHFFPFLDYLLDVSLPTFWDIYAYGGAKLYFNIYQKGDLDLQDMDIFSLGFQFGGGCELFLSDKVSLRLEGAWCTNSFDFEIDIAGQRAFSGDVSWQNLQIMLGMQYYF